MADTTTTPTTSTLPCKISILDIPELIAEVGQHLSYYNYFQCLLVSKSFYNAFQPLLWKHFDPPLDTPFVDPSLIRKNLSYIQDLTLSVLDHDLLSIFTANLPVHSVMSPSLFFREEKVSITEKKKSTEETEEITFTTTTLPSSLSTILSSAMNNLRLDNQPRCTNLKTLSFSDAGFCLTPKEHLHFLSNIITLILHNPNINTLHIPVDILAFYPTLFLEILQHHLPQLERLELGLMTSKGYSYSPSSTSDYGDLGLVRTNTNNDNMIKVAQFSGKVDWETTVQLLETCLWNRQKNKKNAFLTHLRCLYYITGNINHIPTSTLQSQYDRLCYPSSSVNTTTTTSSSSSSSTSSAHDKGEGDDLEEPRLKDLTLPRWGVHESKYSFYTLDRTYLNSFIVPLVDQLPYLARFYPRSLGHERYLEDDFDNAVAAADIGIDYLEREDYTLSSRGRRRVCSRRQGEEKENKLGLRYRWRMKPDGGCPCSVCNPPGEED